jgi:hypothetical protein
MTQASEPTDRHKPACQRCRFACNLYPSGTIEDTLFECRRYAPKPIRLKSEDDVSEWGWVQVLAHEWCGEFEADTLP